MLIPTQLVIDTCYATFVKLEGDKLGGAETKATWEGRVAMVASNRKADEGEQEPFVVSKYDLLPENLADMVQVSCMPDKTKVLGTGLQLFFLLQFRGQARVSTSL